MVADLEVERHEVAGGGRMNLSDAKYGMRVVWTDLAEDKLGGGKCRRSGVIVGIGNELIYVKPDGRKSKDAYSPSFWKPEVSK